MTKKITQKVYNKRKETMTHYSFLSRIGKQLRVSAVTVLTISFLFATGVVSAKKRGNINKLAYKYSKHVAVYKIRAAEMGFSVDGMVYQGDLSPNVGGSPSDLSPGAAFVYKRFIDERFSGKFKFRVGSLSGNDKNYADQYPYRGYRGFSFKTLLVDASAAVEWEVLGYKLPYSFWWTSYGVPKTFFTPYVSAGIGFMFFNPEANYDNYDSTKFGPIFKKQYREGIEIDHKKEFSRFAFKIPVTVGVKYYTNKRWCLFLEGEFNVVFTDYLDGISKSVLPNNDDFYSINIGLLHTIPGNVF